jgi:predicted membrane protein
MTNSQILGFTFLGVMFLWCLFLLLIDYLIRIYKEKKQEKTLKHNLLLLKYYKRINYDK